MRLLSAAWCELETPGVLRRQPFSRNGSFDKRGVDWIRPTCTKCPSGTRNYTGIMWNEILK